MSLSLFKDRNETFIHFNYCKKDYFISFSDFRLNKKIMFRVDDSNGILITNGYWHSSMKFPNQMDFLDFSHLHIPNEMDFENEIYSIMYLWETEQIEDTNSELIKSWLEKMMS